MSPLQGENQMRAEGPRFLSPGRCPGFRYEPEPTDRIMPSRTLCLFTLSLLAFGFAHAQPPKTDPPKSDPAKKADAVTYKDHVLPILRKHCLNCHNADKATSDLDVSTYQALMAGGASGEAVKAGN